MTPPVSGGLPDLAKLAQAFLVADDVLAKRVVFRGSLLGIEIVSDARMPRDCWALGHREGALVVEDASRFLKLFRSAQQGEA